MTSKWRHTLKFLMNLNSGPKNGPMFQIWAWSSNYLENNSSFFVFSNQKMTWHTGNKRLLWQHLITMVIDKIRKMSIKGVKLKSESYFSISPGVLELWTKNLRGRIPPPSPDRVKAKYTTTIGQHMKCLNLELLRIPGDTVIFVFWWHCNTLTPPSRQTKENMKDKTGKNSSHWCP